MLIVFSYASWPSVCLHWRNVYVGLLSTFWLGFFFFSLLNIELHELFANFRDKPLVSCIICKSFLLFWELSFHFVYGFFAVQKLLSLIGSICLFLCFFCFHYSWKWIEKDIAAIYIKKWFAHVFLLSFIVFGLTFRSLIYLEFIFVCGGNGELNNVTCSNTDGPGDYHSKWNKLEKDRWYCLCAKSQNKWYKWTYLWNRKKTHRFTKWIYGWGSFGWHVYTTIFKIDNQHGPTVTINKIKYSKIKFLIINTHTHKNIL